MKNTTLTIFLILIVFLTSPFTYGDDLYLPIKQANTPPNIHIEIKPEIELIAGVLSHTSQCPIGIGNEYSRELKSFFVNYKDHQAFKLADELTQKGFSIAYPLIFILSLGPLPNLEPVNGYAAYLEEAAGGYDQLENFRQELVELAVESNFIKFYQEHRPLLEEVFLSSAKEYNGARIVAWLQDFFNTQGDEYHLVLVPAIFPQGGYGPTIETKDGRKHFYQIVKERGKSAGKPEFGTTFYLEENSLHEWGHSFLKPSLTKHSAEIDALVDLYYPVILEMFKKSYQNHHVFFNEQILRAVVILAIEDLYGVAEAQTQLKYEKKRGFYLTEFTLEQLRYYRKNRAKYPSFSDFIPYLLNCYEKRKEDLLLLASASIHEKLKEVKVLNAYWEGDPNIQGIKAKSTHNILIEVEFGAKLLKQIDYFIKKAGIKFELIAANKPIVKAKIYEGSIYQVNNRTFWGLWLAVNEKDYAMIEPGISYKLAPKRQNSKYRWILTEDVSLILSKP